MNETDKAFEAVTVAMSHVLTALEHLQKVGDFKATHRSRFRDMASRCRAIGLYFDKIADLPMSDV